MDIPVCSDTFKRCLFDDAKKAEEKCCDFGKLCGENTPGEGYGKLIVNRTGKVVKPKC